MKYAILIISLTTIGFFFLKGLSIDPSVVPSNLLSHDTPSFKLEELPQKELLQDTDFLDKNNLQVGKFLCNLVSSVQSRTSTTNGNRKKICLIWNCKKR